MIDDRYQEIRDALAMGPTPGPWVQDGDGVSAEDEDVAVAMCCPSDAEAAYIAACDPDTIRELLAERDQLAAALEAAREDAARYRWLRTMAREQLLNPKMASSEYPDMRTYWRLPTLICSGPVGGFVEFDAAIDQARGKGGQEVGDG